VKIAQEPFQQDVLDLTRYLDPITHSHSLAEMEALLIISADLAGGVVGQMRHDFESAASRLLNRRMQL